MKPRTPNLSEELHPTLNEALHSARRVHKSYLMLAGTLVAVLGLNSCNTYSAIAELRAVSHVDLSHYRNWVTQQVRRNDNYVELTRQVLAAAESLGASVSPALTEAGVPITIQYPSPLSDEVGTPNDRRAHPSVPLRDAFDLNEWWAPPTADAPWVVWADLVRLMAPMRGDSIEVVGLRAADSPNSDQYELTVIAVATRDHSTAFKPGQARSERMPDGRVRHELTTVAMRRQFFFWDYTFLKYVAGEPRLRDLRPGHRGLPLPGIVTSWEDIANRSIHEAIRFLAEHPTRAPNSSLLGLSSTVAIGAVVPIAVVVLLAMLVIHLEHVARVATTTMQETSWFPWILLMTSWKRVPSILSVFATVLAGPAALWSAAWGTTSGDATRVVAWAIVIVLDVAAVRCWWCLQFQNPPRTEGTDGIRVPG